jgi:hypothetical protein
MSDTPRPDVPKDVIAERANLAATIERATADLGLSEEPSSFATALEEAAADE